jgi:hypothetical protein
MSAPLHTRRPQNTQVFHHLAQLPSFIECGPCRQSRLQQTGFHSHIFLTLKMGGAKAHTEEDLNYGLTRLVPISSHPTVVLFKRLKNIN